MLMDGWGSIIDSSDLDKDGVRHEECGGRGSHRKSGGGLAR